MKKVLWIGSIISVVILVLAAVGYAYALAQAPTPQTRTFGRNIPDVKGGWRDNGDWSGMMRGMRGGRMMGAENYGLLHDYMVKAIAEELGMTPEELQAQIDAGKTSIQVALDKGLSENEVRDLMLKAHDKAFEQAVADGKITKEQADWMDKQFESRWSNGDLDSCPCQGGFFGPSGGRSGPRGRWNTQPTK